MDDIEYFRRRALEERERAANADSAHVANTHQELARHYEKLVARSDIRLTSRGKPANQNDAGRSAS